MLAEWTVGRGPSGAERGCPCGPGPALCGPWALSTREVPSPRGLGCSTLAADGDSQHLSTQTRLPTLLWTLVDSEAGVLGRTRGLLPTLPPGPQDRIQARASTEFTVKASLVGKPWAPFGGICCRH